MALNFSWRASSKAVTTGVVGLHLNTDSLMTSLSTIARGARLAIGLAVAAAAPAHAQFTPQLDPVQAELFLEYDTVPAGSQFDMVVRLTPEPGWHTYWMNPGDAGRATTTVFSGVDSMTVSPPRWPVPDSHREDVLVTYGYGEQHSLLYTAQLPPDFDGPEVIQAKVSWLVCKDICIPGSATLSEVIAPGPRGEPRNADIFSAARAHIPQAVSKQNGRFALVDGEMRFALPAEFANPDELFPDTQYLVNHAGKKNWSADGLRVAWPLAFDGVEAPPALRVLAVKGDKATWVKLDAGEVAAVGESQASAPVKAAMTVLRAVLLAFFGGMLLNLMPCVFPVLALKAMGLSRGENLAEKRHEAWIYTAGVLTSFVGLAAVLLGLRATGAALGWGFQLQNPAVVAVLAIMLGFFGLAMAGWTQIGMGLMGMGQNLTQGKSPRAAFFTGVLAVVVASPCTAPFMGAALGFAVTQPAVIALAIFASLGLGLAAPILLIALVPALATRLPKPGPWMDKFKHVMAIPLIGTAIWLFWVVANQAGYPALGVSVLALLVLAIVSRQSPKGRWVDSAGLRTTGWLVAAALAITPALLPPAEARVAGDWQPWSAERVAELRAAGQPVFVDFTADWCISCLVNEKTALSDASVQALLAEKNLVLLKADWTRQDPAITAGLAEFDRNGVPLYLVYNQQGEVEVLPQLLTPSIVRAALEKL